VLRHRTAGDARGTGGTVALAGRFEGPRIPQYPPALRHPAPVLGAAHLHHPSGDRRGGGRVRRRGEGSGLLHQLLYLDVSGAPGLRRTDDAGGDQPGAVPPDRPAAEGVLPLEPAQGTAVMSVIRTVALL